MDLFKSNKMKDARKKLGGVQREDKQLVPNAGSVIQKPYDIMQLSNCEKAHTKSINH